MLDVRLLLLTWALLVAIGMGLWGVAYRFGWLRLGEPFDLNVYRTWPWWAVLIEVTIFVLLAFAALAVMTEAAPSLPRFLAYAVAAVGSHILMGLLQRAGLFRK